jgi:2,3-dihydroxybiphenyl 1,2-dioxygenase
MTGVKELAYVVYEASSLDDWEHFGVSLLGMQLAEKSADAIALRTDRKAHRWLVRRGPADDLVASGYEVTDDAALDALIERLTAAGVEVAEGDADLAASRAVDRIAVTADPMGNRVELVTGFADAPTPFHSDALLGEFVTGAGGAGHHVLLSKGVARETYLEFYEGLLGFRISDRIVEELAPGAVADLIFLRCNPRHHSVAFARGPHVSLHHVSFEMRGVEEFMRGSGRVIRSGAKLVWGQGRHLAGDNTYSYFLDPHHNTIEYTTELEELDEDSWHPHVYDTSDPNVQDQWGTANPFSEAVAKDSFNDVDPGVFVAPPV